MGAVSSTSTIFDLAADIKQTGHIPPGKSWRIGESHFGQRESGTGILSVNNGSTGKYSFKRLGYIKTENILLEQANSR
jgi:hypothetical protein